MNRDEIDKTERNDEGMEVEEQVGGAATTVARYLPDTAFKALDSVFGNEGRLPDIDLGTDQALPDELTEISMSRNLFFNLFLEKDEQKNKPKSLELYTQFIDRIFPEGEGAEKMYSGPVRAAFSGQDLSPEQTPQPPRRQGSTLVAEKVQNMSTEITKVFENLVKFVNQKITKEREINKINYDEFKVLLFPEMFKLKIMAILILLKENKKVSIDENKNIEVEGQKFFTEKYEVTQDNFKSQNIYERLKDLGVITNTNQKISEAIKNAEDKSGSRAAADVTGSRAAAVTGSREAPTTEALDANHQKINGFLQKCNEIKRVYDTKYRDSYQAKLKSNPGQTDQAREAAARKARGEAEAEAEEEAAAKAKGIVQKSQGVYQGTILTDKVVTLKTDFTFNTVDLSEKPLGYFPRAFLYFEGLTELNLSGCGLTYIPDDIDKLSSVKILDLSNNEIRSVPDSLTALAYTADVIDLTGNLLCREVPGQMVMEPVLPVDTVEAYQSRMDQEIKTHADLLAKANAEVQAAVRAASPEQQDAAQKRLESLNKSNFQIQQVTKYSIVAQGTTAPNILKSIKILNDNFNPESGIVGALTGINESKSGEILAEGQIYIGTVIKLKITQTEASGGSTSKPSDKYLLFTPLILDTFPQKPENQIYELYQQSIVSTPSEPTTADQPNTGGEAEYTKYQSCERLQSRINSYLVSAKGLINKLTTGEDANNYIDAYAELMSICKEYKRLNSAGFQGESFPGAEECPDAIQEGEKFSIGDGAAKKELTINELYKKWLVALRIIHAKSLTGNNSIENNALLHLNFANMLGRKAYTTVTSDAEVGLSELPTVEKVTDFLNDMKGEVSKKKPKQNKYINQKIEEQENNQKIGQITSFLNQAIQPVDDEAGDDPKPSTIELPRDFNNDHLKNVDIDLRLKYILIQGEYSIDGDNNLIKDNIKVFKDELIDTFGMTQKIDASPEEQSGSVSGDAGDTEAAKRAAAEAERAAAEAERAAAEANEIRGKEFNIITNVLNGIIQRQIDLVGAEGTGGITSATDDYSIRLNIIKFILKNRNLFEGLTVTSFKDLSEAREVIDFGDDVGKFTIDSFDKVKLGFGLVSHIFELKDELGGVSVEEAIKAPARKPDPDKDLSAKIEPLRYLINNIQLLAKAFPDTPALQVNKNHGAIQKCMGEVAKLLKECWGNYSSAAATEDLENIKLKNTLEDEIMNLQGNLATASGATAQQKLKEELTQKQEAQTKLNIPYILEYFNMLAKMPARPTVGTASA